MRISISEHTEVFHVPYGTPNNDGSPDGNYVDVKANIEWISVLPSCIGWPEIQRLLRVINAPSTPFMSLAADQGVAETENTARPFALTSFVILCLADIPSNTKRTITRIADFLKDQLTESIQHTANALQRPLYLQVRLEIQPTHFHHHAFEGWSLMVLMAVSETNKRLVRHTWSLAVLALEHAVSNYVGNQHD